MKLAKFLIVFLFIGAVIGCTNKGIETGTPVPLEDVAVQLQAAGHGTYRLITGEDGQGFIQKVDDEGAVVEQVAITVYVVAGNSFETTATFSDGTVILIKGSVDADGKIASISMTIDGLEVVLDISYPDDEEEVELRCAGRGGEARRDGRPVLSSLDHVAARGAGQPPL